MQSYLFVCIQRVDHLLHEERRGDSSDDGRQDGQNDLHAVVFGHFCLYVVIRQGRKEWRKEDPIRGELGVIS